MPNTSVTAFLGFYLSHYLPMPSMIGLKQIGFPRPIIRKTSKVFQRFVNVLWFRAFLSQSNSQFELYHPTGYFLREVPSTRCRIVLTVHDLIHEKYPEYFHHGSRRSGLTQELVDRVDAVIAVSGCTKKDLVEFFKVSSSKIHVVCHGNSLVSTNRSVISLASNLPSPYILYVGERKGYKNFKTFLAAYLDTKSPQNDFRLVCFGGGKLDREEIALLGNARQSVFWLEGSDTLLAQLYRNAAALVYPSLYEGFGMPLVEAMGLGCPVVASNRASIPEVLDGAGYLFDPENFEEIKTALTAVLYDDQLRTQMIDRGYERAKTFSWDNCARETMQVYRSLL